MRQVGEVDVKFRLQPLRVAAPKGVVAQLQLPLSIPSFYFFFLMKKTNFFFFVLHIYIFLLKVTYVIILLALMCHLTKFIKYFNKI
jgi:hypothetical protein